jgi:hypothetical protein
MLEMLPVLLYAEMRTALVKAGWSASGGGPGRVGHEDPANQIQLGRGQAVRRGTLDPVFGGSNPPAPTKLDVCVPVGVQGPDDQT